MRVDFYQLGGGAAAEDVIAALATKLLAEQQRLVVVAEDEALLARLDRQLWDHSPLSFIPHGVSGGVDDARQPVLLTTGTDAPNGARNLLIADGQWREAALHFDRAFHLFDSSSVEQARKAWRDLSGHAEVERHYWSSESGKWVEKS